VKRRSLIAAGLGGVASVALHAGLVIGLAPEAPPSLAGGAPQLAMVGNSFEDTVAGSVTGTTDPMPTPPVETSPEVAERAAPVPTPAASAPAAAPVAHVTKPPMATRADVARTLTSPTATAVASAAPVVPSPRASAPVARPAAAATRETVPARNAPVARAPDPDTPRPQPRAARPTPAPAPDSQAPTRPRQPTPQGNAAETARAGDARGAAEGSATSTQAGTTGQAESDGRAAAEYPQRVNRHLVRLRRPSTRFEGTAVVSFTIADSGGLAALLIARSSGNTEFDRLALTHVQRAAPFPPPPAGAQRRFNVTVQGR
jgi:protein TonB